MQTEHASTDLSATEGTATEGSASERPTTARPTTERPTTEVPTETPAARRPRSPARPLRRLREDSGAATAEYLVATMAAVGFAGLLIVILRGDEVRGILTELVRTALSVG